MKSWLPLLVLVALLVFGMQGQAWAVEPITVNIDDELIKFTINPIQEQGTTLVEFRPIFEKFGLKVNWDEKTQTVTGEKEGLEIKLKLGSKVATVNGVTKKLFLAPRTIKGRTMVPIRFVGEASGAIVIWYEKLRFIDIGYKLDNKLSCAINADDADMVKEFLLQGANPNFVNYLGERPLESAIPLGKTETVQALVYYGADINAKDRLGDTPLMIAIIFYREDMVNLLINSGADLTIQDNYGDTALKIAQDFAANENILPEYRAIYERIVKRLE